MALLPGLLLLTGSLIADPYFSRHPNDQTILAGKGATFTVDLGGVGYWDTVFYQWEYSNNGGYSWDEVPEYGSYYVSRSSTTDTLETTSTPPGFDGTLYRCRVSYPIDNIYSDTAFIFSDEALLTVNAEPYNIGRLPASQTAFEKEPVTLVARAGGQPAPVYQWQVSGDGGTSWHNIQGATRHSLTFTAGAGFHNGDMIRRIASNGIGSPAYSNTFTLNVIPAFFHTPAALALDDDGNLYVADSFRHVIYKVAPDLTATLFAGAVRKAALTDSSGTDARFNAPVALAFDTTGDLLVADSGNGAVRKITPEGEVNTVATGLASPGGIATTAGGNVLIADTDAHVIYEIDSHGELSTHAGLAGAPGFADATGDSARFRNPTQLHVDDNDDIFIADTGNHIIRTAAEDGSIITWAGYPGASGTANGNPATSARFDQPRGMASDTLGSLYVADTGNSTIRRITDLGYVLTIAGRARSAGFADGTGNTARFNRPSDIVFDGNKSLYVADTGNSVIRKVDLPTGKVVTLAIFKAGTTPPPPNTHVLTVIKGKGSGNYAEGERISLVANDPPSGTVFDGWMSINGGSFSNAKNTSTTFTMPANATSVYALYEPVNSGNSGVVTKKDAYGGGAPSLWFFAALTALIALRRRE
ncbi:InlB B-repeat-containing protein [Ereboglobus luteus]|uniref:Bacterial repeat domain-containing protein n=1 Tax=Ereboglobus luteus TaxID=1796921 RepID=A0A2U8DZI8_9BACT|nr:hypothetical protein [Ereboglobus luteus]AWI08023.1 hypothetical protein CKA38_00970 [Ereboglobus luteus]